MSDASEWVSLGEAAEIIGVHPATIRNWAERGELPCRRTPGGHRRFRRSDLQQWLAANRVVQPAEAQVVVQSALGRTRLELSSKQQLSELPWFEHLSTDTRQAMRDEGLRIMDTLIHFLTKPAPQAGLLQAQDIGRVYGHLTRAAGLSLSKAIEAYLYFSNFPIEAIIQLSETNISPSVLNWGDMLRQVNLFTRKILLGLIEAYDEAEEDS
jgi:excisionase family DNA binding protein